MARRTKAEALETREQIIDAAERVFHKKGVSRSSLSDIAEEAGVTQQEAERTKNYLGDR